jgi:hypothetical protein
MGYSLEFYCLSWEMLRSELTKRRPDVTEAAYESQWMELWEDEEDPTSVWARALDEISTALAIERSGSTESLELSDDAALAFVAIVRRLGSYLGSLEHASASGEYFREEFLSRIAAGFFQEPLLGEYLTERPFHGLTSDVYPSWGGLRQAEVSQLMNKYRPPGQELEEDFSIWLDELVTLLEDATDAKNDLVTLYL